MKQKAAIEKSYAEGLLKLSSVYGSKKIATKVGIDTKDSKDPESQDAGSSQTVFQLWLKVLEENEKVANLRLAAAQVREKIKFVCVRSNCELFFLSKVFQEKISDEAKNLRTIKAVKAKKFVDR